MPVLPVHPDRRHPQAALSGRDFSGTAFPGLIIDDCVLADASFANTNLVGAEIKFMQNVEDLAGHVNFSGSDLRTATLLLLHVFEGQVLDLAGSNLEGATLNSIDADGDLDLTGANLRDAFVGGNATVQSTLPGLIWEGADLAGATIEFASLGSVASGALGIPVNADLATWSGDTVCPDGVTAEEAGGTCVGHFRPLP